jgi:hypothetical protein
MKKILALILLSVAAMAQNNTTTPTAVLGIPKPDIGSLNWGITVRNNYDLLDKYLSAGLPVPQMAFTNYITIGGGSHLTTTNQTGTGSLVLQNSPTLNSPTLSSPTLVSPILGVAAGTSLALSGGLTIAGGTSLATTNQTGTGNLVLQNSPSLVTPSLGVASGSSLALGGGTALTTTNQTGTGSLVLAAAPSISNATMSGGTFTPLGISGQLDATQCSGADIGAKVNACIALLPSSCGAVYIPGGSYTQSTSIHKPRCVKLRGAVSEATVLNWTGSASGWAIVVSDANVAGPYAAGAVEDLTLNGPGTTGNGVFLGGDPANVISPSTDNGDHENLNRLRIKGFSVGVGYGNQAWSDTIFESVVYGNVTGVKALGTTTFGERMTIIASSIQNNSHYAIDGNGFKSPGFSVKLIGSSIDYNGNGTDAVIQGGYISEGSHFEQTTGLFFDMTGATAGWVQDHGGIYIMDHNSCFGRLDSSSQPSSFVGATFSLNTPGPTNLLCTTNLTNVSMSQTTVFGSAYNDHAPNFIQAAGSMDPTRNNIVSEVLNDGYDPGGEILPHFSSTFLAGQLTPSNATVLLSAANIGAIASFCNSLGETRCNSVAGYFFAHAYANGAAVWGENPLASDAPGITGSSLRAGEDDVNVYGSPTLAYGRQITGLLGIPGSVLPTSTIGLLINTAAVNGGAWVTGIQIDNGTVSGKAMNIGSTNRTAGIPANSLPFWWNFAGPDGAGHIVVQYVDQFGSMNFNQSLTIIASAPTCTFTSGGGTSPSCSVDTGSTNMNGIISLTTGTGAPLGKGTATLTFTNFGSAFFGNNNPSCTFIASDEGAGTWQDIAVMKVKTPSHSSVLFAWMNGTGPTTLSTSTAYKVHYHCWSK